MADLAASISNIGILKVLGTCIIIFLLVRGFMPKEKSDGGNGKSNNNNNNNGGQQ